jgi:hypothetical protein
MSDNMKVRFVRVGDPLWDRALNKTRHEGTTVAAVMRDALADYVEDRPIADELKRIIKRLNGINKRLGGEGIVLSGAVRKLLTDYLEDRSVTDELQRAIFRLNAIQKRLELAE